MITNQGRELPRMTRELTLVIGILQCVLTWGHRAGLLFHGPHMSLSLVDFLSA